MIQRYRHRRWQQNTRSGRLQARACNRR